MNLGKKVIYQAYPRSFMDTSGDGIGDLNGITSKIDYFKELGVDMIWVNPFFISPQKDNGYDITDYYHVDELFGSDEDFDNMIKVFNENNIGIMLDMVLNHTSIENERFKKALEGDEFYQNFYYIREPKADGSYPTNRQSKFGGPARASFGDTGKYYLCLYDKSQADLNWNNEDVREEIFKIINYRIDKGVMGFRFDVINVIGKSQDLEDSDGNPIVEKALYTDTPIVHKYIREMNLKTFGKDPEIITVGEMSSTDIVNALMYSSADGAELSMVFNFHHLKVDYEDGEKWSDMAFDFIKLKEIFNDRQVGMQDGGGWNAVFWNNHDQPRANNRFGDVINYPYETATMLAQSIHMLRGTPYIYQGEEIAMTDPDFDDMRAYKDIESLNAYEILLNKGKTEKEAFEIIKKKSRDNSRTPMQWNADNNAGFSEGEPRIKINDNYKDINVENAINDENSVFYYYKKLIELRKKLDIISDGLYFPILKDDAQIFGYIREYEGDILINLNNFSAKEAKVDIKSILKDHDKFRYLLGNYGSRDIEDILTLNPYETISFIKEQ